MKINHFKLGAIAFIVLGAMHELAYLLKGKVDEPQLANTLDEMKNTTIHIFGEHSLMKFYDGFSLTMGFLLLAFGLQAVVITKPDRRVALVNGLVALVTLILTIIYFHLVASSLMFIALVCFMVSFIKLQKT